MSPMPAPNQIATARLLLRPIAAADAPALFSMMSDPPTMRYWSTPPWTAMPEADAFIHAAQTKSPDNLDVLFGIELRASGLLVGTCTLFDVIVPSRRAEVGYLLDRRHWGLGIMSEAATALLSYGFGALALNRVEADIDPRNLSSARLLERLGFVREGLLRARWIVSGEVSDSAIYGLLASEWKEP